MTRTTVGQQVAQAHADVKREADAILDRLVITERAYHHLDLTKPLVTELASRLLVAQPPGSRVLVIGSDSLLAHLLLRRGYHVDLWHFRDGILTDDLAARIQAMVTPEQLADANLPLDGEPYDAIILPLILESLPGDPTALLARLRLALRTNGSLIVATTNVSRLDLRLMALIGRNTASAYPSFHVSLSFPPLPRRRYFHRDELIDLSRRAGFQVHECAYVIAQAACSPITPLPVDQYTALQVGHALQQAIPSTRHAILLQLSPRIGDQHEIERTDTGYASVSVVISSCLGADAMRVVLGALTEQDFPADHLEIMILHDGRSSGMGTAIRQFAEHTAVPIRELIMPHPEGAVARNQAMKAATGTICAHTDDACLIPPGWLRTVATSFNEETGVITGPVIELPGSHPDYLVLPGTRLGWNPHEFYPIFNVAYRRQAALAAGGFEESANGRIPGPYGWDAELAHRLQRLGWRGRFLRDSFLYRKYQIPGSRQWIKPELQLAEDLPRAVSRIPALADQHVIAGFFASVTTLTFDLLIVGLLAAALRRRRAYLALALPWFGYYSKFVDLWPVSRWPYNVRLFRQLGVRHVVWLGGLIRGSIKAKRLVL